MTDPFADATLRSLADAFLLQEREHAVVVMDCEGRIVGWLAAAERLLGFRADEIVGRHIATIFTADDRHKHQAEQEMEVAMAEGRSEDDRWHVRSNGGRVWVTGSMTVLKDSTGSIIGFVKVMRDRTDLRTHVETLETRVERLLRRHEASSQFLSTLGHELRTPLGAIGYATQMIAMRSSDGSLAAPLGVLKRQAAAIQRLADDLIDLCSLDLDRVEMRLSRFAVQDLARDCLEGFKARAQAHRIELVAMLPDVAIELTADRERLQQVVQILLDNALKYTPDGGRISIRTVSEPPDVVVRVEDNGIGISPDMLMRVFDLFTRAVPATDAAREGLGIGLAVARQVVELHGGSIEARSAGEGKGSVFAMRLPAAGPPEAKEATAPLGG